MRGLVIGLAALATSTWAEPLWATDEGLHLRDHPLVDTILRTADHTVVARAALEGRLQTVDYVIIGEKHDNARHHAVQADLVEMLGAAGDLRAVAFEMLPRDRQLAVSAHLQGGGTAAGLADAVDWASLGWGPWTWYGPIVDAAHRHGATVVAADISRADSMGIHRRGLESLDAAFTARSGLDTPLDPDEQAVREAAMTAAHCGYDLGTHTATMVDVQRARDAMMADRLVTLANRGQGVLITGNGHADTERGVPLVLHHLRPEAAVLSIGLIEVEPEWQRLPEISLPYDYVWFTPRAKPVDFDYCAQFRLPRG